jgi:hypothetical protein
MHAQEESDRSSNHPGCVGIFDRRSIFGGGSFLEDLLLTPVRRGELGVAP